MRAKNLHYLDTDEEHIYQGFRLLIMHHYSSLVGASRLHALCLTDVITVCFCSTNDKIASYSLCRMLPFDHPRTSTMVLIMERMSTITSQLQFLGFVFKLILQNKVSNSAAVRKLYILPTLPHAPSLSIACVRGFTLLPSPAHSKIFIGQIKRPFLSHHEKFIYMLLLFLPLTILLVAMCGTKLNTHATHTFCAHLVRAVLIS